MKSIRKYTHRGEILRKVAENHDLSITKIAKKAGYSRTSFYVHAAQSDLSFEILQQYGRAMNHDFAEDLPEIKKYIVDDPESIYMDATVATLEQAIKQRDIWRDKYYALIEKLAAKNFKL